ncbi:MAG TPA: hypothetical protein VKU60_17990, partial [Chloroflexota bacterium]|nr:hypothetical protein [Chloroflexota bacterium]
MKSFASNRFLWVVLGLVFVAMLGFGAISSQQSVQQPAVPATPQASATAQATPSSSSGSFLPDYQDPQVAPAPNGFLTIAGLLFKLAIVVGLIYLTVLGLRYFSHR